MTPKQSIKLNEAMKVMQKKYRKALKAIRLARDIMDYCQGDSWEREATEKDRKSFGKIADELAPLLPPRKKDARIKKAVARAKARRLTHTI